MNSCLISNRLFCQIFFLPLTAKCGCGVSLLDSFFAHSVICQLDVPLVVQQNVVQLQIAVDYPWKPRRKEYNIRNCLPTPNGPKPWPLRYRPQKKHPLINSTSPSEAVNCDIWLPKLPPIGSNNEDIVTAARSSAQWLWKEACQTDALPCWIEA